MIFNSFAFAVFLPLILLLYYLLPFRWQNRLLLVGSLVFYAWWDTRFLLLLGFTIAVDFYAAQAVYREPDLRKKRRWLLVSVVTNLGVLGIFKYSGFFVENFASLLEVFGFQANLPTLNFILPVGISFYTFMSMAYVIDVYRGELEPTTHFFDFALFVSYFPHLVAGPILRAPQLLPQLTNERKPHYRQIANGIALIVVGLFRKVVIADLLAPTVNEIFASPNSRGGFDLVIGMWLFAIQLYGDFAGYSDIARGVSKLFGIDLNLNFATPFLSQNITEFWRRWHISLSSWLRDYLYIPLGGNRKGKLRTYENNMITMLVGGLWHGANWTYIIWGGINGAYLALHKAWIDLRGFRHGRDYSFGRARGTRDKNLPPRRWTWKAPIKIFITFNLVAFAFLIFRSPTIGSAVDYGTRMVSDLTSLRFVGTALFVFPIVGLSFLLDLAQYTGLGERIYYRVGVMPRIVVLGLMFAVVLIAGSDNSQPFIYFQF